MEAATQQEVPGWVVVGTIREAAELINTLTSRNPLDSDGPAMSGWAHALGFYARSERERLERLSEMADSPHDGEDAKVEAVALLSSIELLSHFVMDPPATLPEGYGRERIAEVAFALSIPLCNLGKQCAALERQMMAEVDHV